MFFFKFNQLSVHKIHCTYWNDNCYIEISVLKVMVILLKRFQFRSDSLIQLKVNMLSYMSKSTILLHPRKRLYEMKTVILRV